MKFKLQNTPQQCELIRATASRDPVTARNAQSTLAGLLQPLIDQVLPQIDTTTAFFSEFRFDQDTDPSLPVEPLLYEGADNLTVWYQNRAGGLPSNFVVAPTSEIKFSTYRLDSAISWDNKFARKSRLDVVSKYLERLMQTILIKTNRQAWSALLTVLATASYNGVSNVKRAITTGAFTLDDLSKLMTRIRRQNESWYGGSTNERLGKLTDLYISPEVMEQIRSMAYNPINTKVANQITPAGGDGDAAGVVTLPEGERAKYFSDADTQTLFNITLHEMNELGTSQVYNTLFKQVAGSTAYTTPAGGGSGAFVATTTEIVIGADLTREFAYRAVSQDPESKAAFQLVPDDQFVSRQEKTGFYGFIEEGRVVTSGRELHAIIV